MVNEIVRINDCEWKIEKIDYESSEYPYRLREIENPPRQLYCIGNIDCLNRSSVGVVGSRKYTIYGKQVAKMVGQKMAMAGVPVVSGLAKGIDGFSHEGVLEASGVPIAVLGCGLRKMYPPTHLELMKNVANNGVVVSEYEPDFIATRWSFPERNRIISGLSEVLVVIEANVNSGSLITAQYALAQGKTIYAVPGNINSQFSMGTNQLIRDGATPLIVIDDILVDMGIEPTCVDTVNLNLKDDEIPIVEALRRNNGITPDVIAHMLNTKVSSINAILTILEIKGIVVSASGKFFLAN